MNFKIDEKIVFYISSFAVILFLGFLAFFLCSPVIEANKEFYEQQNGYAQKNLFLRSLLSARSAGDARQRLFTKESLPLAKDVLARLAKENRVGIVTLRPYGVEKEKKEIYRRMPMGVETVSSFKDLGLFLTAVRNMPEGIIAVESLRVRPQGTSLEQVTAKMTFVLWVAKDNGQK